MLIAFAAMWALFPDIRSWYVLVLGAGFLVRGLAERRRALILTSSSLLYRPAFLGLVRVEFADIASLEEATTMTYFLVYPHFPKGVRVTLVNGSKIVIPLDFPKGSEIFQEIVMVSGSPASLSSSSH